MKDRGLQNKDISQDPGQFKTQSSTANEPATMTEPTSSPLSLPQVRGI